MSCVDPIHCIFGTGNAYDGEYTSGDTFNGYSYFTGDTSPTYYMYFSTGATQSFWCLSTSLGGTCDQVGQMNSFSLCPDFWNGFYSVGACPTTTTTTTSPCDVFDFAAIFDCILPSATPTATPTSTPTPTPTPSPDPCFNKGLLASLSAYTPTPTPTMSVTPTPTTTYIDRPCKLSGSANFNVFDEYMRCGNSKYFRDCFTGIDYYAPDILTFTGGSLQQGYVYKMIVNGVDTCGSFIGLVDNISGIDDIQIIGAVGLEVNGACLECLPPSPTPTNSPTPTPTPTPTPSATPCGPKQYLIEWAVGPCKYKIFYCNGTFEELTTNVAKTPSILTNSLLVCSTATPVVISGCKSFSATIVGDCPQ